MTFMFRPAAEVESTRPILIGLAGGTGSGKTYSALRLAHGLGSKVAAIDTENGRLLEYKREFPDTLYAALEPPCTPERYLEAMMAAAKVADVVIVDSVSHEWEGVGGLLEWANSKAEAMVVQAKENGQHWATVDKYTFPAWKEPKMAHQKMVSWMISAPCHLVLCFRAKEKKGFEEVEYIVRGETKKKKEIVDLGWQPITESGLPYEMSFLAVLHAAKPGVPDFTFKALSHTYAGIFNGQPISEAHGKQLAALLDGQNGTAKTASTGTQGGQPSGGPRPEDTPEGGNPSTTHADPPGSPDYAVAWVKDKTNLRDWVAAVTAKLETAEDAFEAWQDNLTTFTALMNATANNEKAQGALQALQDHATTKIEQVKPADLLGAG